MKRGAREVKSRKLEWNASPQTTTTTTTTTMLRHLATSTSRSSTRAYTSAARASFDRIGPTRPPLGAVPSKLWAPRSATAMPPRRFLASNIPPPPPPVPTPFPVYVAGAAFLSLGAFYASVRLGYVKDPFVGIEELEKIGNGELMGGVVPVLR